MKLIIDTKWKNINRNSTSLMGPQEDFFFAPDHKTIEKK
jgi:hypothetical protein